jgi:choline dehydrogenase
MHYIIIGAGSAGCVVANRLSANPDNEVLLIEAGGKDTKPEIHIPAAYGQLNYTNVDWGYYTQPQEHANNRRLYQPRGKTLGGSSSTNAMAYVRGNKNDYDDWERMGAQGWNYDSLLPYFKKSEHNEQIQDQYHGQSGPLNVSFAQQYQTPVSNGFIKACQEQGIPFNPDYNGAQQEGCSHFQFTIKNAKRHSTAAAFLKPIMSRKNLHIMTKTTVKRILIENDRAIGVEYMVGKNATQKVFASKEVILSAGAFGSPQILMLSGIGNAQELKKNGIEVKKNLEGVGQNLHDHLMSGVSVLSSWKGTMNNVLKPLNQLKHGINWLVNKKGPLTISPLESNAFTKSDPSLAQPDIQLFFVPGHFGNEDWRGKADIYKPNSYPKFDGFSILPVLLQPKSRGYLALRSANPLDAPIIQPNYLQSEHDRAILIKGVRIAKDIMLAEGLSAFRLNNKLYYPTHSDNDEQILAHIKDMVECVYHPVSTCRMGTDPDSVVDPQLRVHGIEGLRVIDASVMPKIISGNTNAPSIMIGEKGADLIMMND